MAIILVVIVHAAAPFSVAYGQISNIDWHILNYWNSIAHACVPLFVMITGGLLLNRSIDDPGEFVRRRLPRTLIPLAIWVLIYKIADNGRGTEIGEVVDAAFSATGKYHLWYLYTISGLYLISPVLSAFLRDAKTETIRYFFAVWFICQSVQTLSPLFRGHTNGISFATMQMLGTWPGYLILGAILARTNVLGSGWYGLAFLGWGALGATATWIMVETQRASISLFIEYGSPLIIIMSLCAYNFLAWVWKQANGSIFLKAIVFLGTKSLGIYLLHLLILEYIMQKIANPLMYGGPAVSVLPIAAVTILGCLLVIVVLQRVPGMKWVFGS